MTMFAQIAQAAELYAAQGVTGEVTREAIVLPHSMGYALLPIVAIVSSFGFALIALIGVLTFLALRGRRRDRLIEMAIQNNQPEIARELVGKRTGFWRGLLYVMLFIVGLAMLASSPRLVFLVACVILVYLAIGHERRARLLRKAADVTGGMKERLEAKAAESESKSNNPPNAPTPPDATRT